MSELIEWLEGGLSDIAVVDFVPLFRCMRGAGRPKSYAERGVMQLVAYNKGLAELTEKLADAGFDGTGEEIEKKMMDNGDVEEEERVREMEGLALRIRRLELDRDQLVEELKAASDKLAASAADARALPISLPPWPVGARARTTMAPGSAFGVFGMERRDDAATGAVSAGRERDADRIHGCFPPLPGGRIGSARPAPMSGHSWPSPSPPLTTPAKIRLVSESMRVIKQTLGPEADVVEHLLEADRLKTSILDYFREESEEVQCLVAKAHLSGGLKSSGDAVGRQMARTGCFSLEGFFEELFQLTFPSAHSSLDVGFRKLSQSYPNPTTIVEYSYKFETYVAKLGLNLKANYLKFIEGLSNADVRSSLVRYPYHNLEFRELVTYAMGVQTSLSVQMKGGVKVFACEEEGEENEEVYKVFGRPIRAYDEARKQKNLTGTVCWNCFHPSHVSPECKTKTCKFCQEPNSKVRHLSLLCPRAPRDLSRFNPTERRKEQYWGRKDQGVRSALVSDGGEEVELVNIE